MQIIIFTLFSALVVIPNSSTGSNTRPPRIPIPRQSSSTVAELLASLQSQPAVSYGIGYYGTARGEIFPINDDDYARNKEIQNGFIIGVLRMGLLRPIYDHNLRMVVVRLRDSANVALSAYGAQILPYNQGHSPRARDFGFRSAPRGSERNPPRF